MAAVIRPILRGGGDTAPSSPSLLPRCLLLRCLRLTPHAHNSPRTSG